jgi:hypothetical protein
VTSVTHVDLDAGVQILYHRLHVFELDSTWELPLQISLLEVCLSQVITRAVIGHLSVHAKSSRFC